MNNDFASWRACHTPLRVALSGRQTCQGGRKRIFLGLFTLSCVVVCLFFFIFLILPWLFPVAWLRGLSMTLGVSAIILLGWVCLTLVFHIYTRRNLPFISAIRHLCLRCLLPLMEIVGKLAGVDKKLVRRSFLKVNNELVLAHATPVPPDKLLLLLPHCMQSSKCRIRLGTDLSHCKNCGQCQVGELKILAQSLGFHAALATGGTIARRLVTEFEPGLILAIACERDLASGIQDSYPLPVYGVLNERPFGPCLDTSVPIETLKAALNYFLVRSA